MRKIIFAMFCFFLISGCATTAERGLDTEEIEPRRSVSEEQAVGDGIHREILSQFYPYTAPKVVKYINEVGGEIAKSAKRQDLRYRFTILYDEKIYATSAPGGYVYLTTGMLNFLSNEAELAAVLAHEIARQQYKDPRFEKQKNDMINAASQAGMAFAPMLGPFGSLASLGIILLQAYAESAHKTPEELLLESDENAMKYLLDAGYDPQALLDVLGHFLRAGEKLTPLFYDYYQSRPITEERMAHLKKGFQALSLSEKNLRTDALEYQEVTRGVREIYKTASNP